MIQKLPELVCRSDKKWTNGVVVQMNDEVDCFEKNTVLRVRVLDLFRLRWLLRFVEDDLKTFDKTSLLTWWREKLEEAEELA